MGLKVIIVGAGIAGLCAAVALRQAGHEVEIYEKSAFATEIGAALVISPNGARVLSKLGFSFTNARAVKLGFWNVLHGENLQLLQTIDMSKAMERFGAEAWSIHRVDLHNELLRLATSTTEAGVPAKLHLSSEVVSASGEGSIVLKDGSRRTADLIAAADGLKSVTREVVTELSGPPTPTGMSAFRLLVDTKQLLIDQKLKAVVEKFDQGANLLADVRETVKERHMMAYTCRDGQVLNMVGIHPTREHSVDDPETTKAIMLDEFKHFSPEVLDIVRQATAVKCWPLFAHEPLQTWSKGRIVLIGDSAHPMLPFGGQGANMAIEDGGTLGYLFSDMKDATSIPERLKEFHEARYARAARVQVLSSVRAGREKEVEQKLRLYSDPPGSRVPTNMMERTGHDFGFDVLKKCEQIVRSRGGKSLARQYSQAQQSDVSGLSAGYCVAVVVGLALLLLPSA